MRDPEVDTCARDWLRHAREDLAAAGTLLDTGVPLRIACFHAQQAAEKALKAILVAHQIRFARTHDLAELRRLLPPRIEPSVHDDDLSNLARWAVELRYPGSEPEATLEEARQSVECARDVVASASESLRALGIHEG